MRTLLSILCLVWVTMSALAEEPRIKAEILDLGVLPTGRPAIVNLWYPEGACEATLAKRCLSEGVDTTKVVVISHGSMGSARNYSWLAETLASAGFTVIGLNHYGESSVYGAATQDARASAFTWQRAQDVSAVMARLESANLFQRPLNWNRVVGVGHSAGGQTMALLAGASYDLRRLAAHCHSDVGTGDPSCGYGRDAESAPDAFVAAFDSSRQDPRVKKVVLMDPALGSAVRQDSLNAIGVPTLLIAAVHSEILPWESHGARYVAGLGGARKILLQGDEGHFIFITPCHDSVKVMGFPLCQDRPGVDRAAVQASLAKSILDFVRANDEPGQVALVARSPTAALDIPRNAALQILRFTPNWVFALLAGLIALGVLQSRTRHVRVWQALLLPTVMLLFSLSGVVLSRGLSWPAISTWAAGLLIAAALGFRFMRSDLATYDADRGRLAVAGSWIPLFAILGIFLVRYAMGVLSARHAAVLALPTVQLSISFALGAMSGIFVARGLRFFRAIQVRSKR